MNFKEFWNELKDELGSGREFTTLKQNKKFTASFKLRARGELGVYITLENGNSRGPITSNEFNGVWDNAKQHSHETRFLNKDRRLEQYPNKNGGISKSMQVAYIIKLIKHVVKDQNME